MGDLLVKEQEKQKLINYLKERCYEIKNGKLTITRHEYEIMPFKIKKILIDYCIRYGGTIRDVTFWFDKEGDF